MEAAQFGFKKVRKVGSEESVHQMSQFESQSQQFEYIFLTKFDFDRFEVIQIFLSKTFCDVFRLTEFALFHQAVSRL